MPFRRESFLGRVRETVERVGFCVVVASEGTRYEDGTFLSESGTVDAFGHAQLGGVAPMLAELVRGELGFKFHWAVADYLQRSARHIASATDVEQAYAVGKSAVELALECVGGMMVTIERTSDDPYAWRVGQAPLAEVANVERKLPEHYIAQDGFGITRPAHCATCAPLIAGEAYPPYQSRPAPVRKAQEPTRAKETARVEG